MKIIGTCFNQWRNQTKRVAAPSLAKSFTKDLSQTCDLSGFKRILDFTSKCAGLIELSKINFLKFFHTLAI